MKKSRIDQEMERIGCFALETFGKCVMIEYCSGLLIYAAFMWIMALQKGMGQ